ncbi:hypothetical protein [Aeromonas caviae]|uniref:hypothetical protein n=1 Tax=Aeromonas caviae TaxID=648 RepID=UPI0016008D40|nr:hypothetical protein [Aeromonas caviae]
MDHLTAKQQAEPVVYYVEAYAQNPDKPGIFCSYRGTVSRDGLIISGEDFDCLLSGFIDHIFVETGVRCHSSTIRLHKLQLVQDDNFRKLFEVDEQHR